MPTLPAPSSTTRKPAWSTQCSTISPMRCARPNSPVSNVAPSEQGSPEDRLIAKYFRPLATAPGAFGLEDDAAIITPPPGCDLVLTTDGVIAGVHFMPHDPPGAIARKVLRMNLSDLAAKGARPVGFLLSVALPVPTEEQWIAAFA